MKRSALFQLGLWLTCAASSPGQTAALDQAARLELQGDFKQAARVLNAELAKELAPAQRQLVAFELDRLERIRKKYPLTRETLFQALKKSVRGLTAAEFDQWIREGRFDCREIDGKAYFMSASVSNLFFRYPELEPRRTPPKDGSELARARLASCAEIRSAALAAGKPYVLPRRFRVNMSVTAEAGAALPGETIRAWLPIPREYPFQNGFALVSASPAVKQVAGPHSAIRSAYLEESARKGKPTRFALEYDYTMRGIWYDLDPAKARLPDPQDPALKPFVSEAPHVIFTPEMRALSDRIAGSETNPVVKARLFYNWIGDNIKYSYAIEYSTIRNISEYCRSHGYGDCGQEALLFITLCRLNGIPARWQSGWNTFPGDENIHDWTEICLAPYGWVPVDPYMSIYAMRYATNLPAAQRRQIRDFYFGGLDQYRICVNSDHNQALDPPKQSMRSDTVDFQRGELEWGGHNIYFDKFEYDLSIRELKPPAGRVD